MYHHIRVLSLFFIFGLVSSHALGKVDLEAYSIEVFGGDAPKAVVIWVGSQPEVAAGERMVLKQMAQSGVKGYYINPFESWFIETEAKGFKEVPVDELSAIIQALAEQHKDMPLFVYARLRFSIPVLEGVSLFQEGGGHIGGVLLDSPLLFPETPKIGALPVYHPIAQRTDAPIYIFQAEFSYAYWYLKEAIAHLEKGGSSVFFRHYPGARGGFLVRDEYSTQSNSVKAVFHQHFLQAMQQLWDVSKGHDGVKGAVVAQKAKKTSGTHRTLSLVPVTGLQINKVLSLRTLEGEMFRLSDQKAKAYLVNFWASWCPPCVYEIPALNRAVQTVEGVELIAVNMGEQKAQILPFMREHPIDGTVLMDTKGEALKAWRVMAFPTTFLLNAQGKITHGVLGAIEWDSKENLAIIKGVVDAAKDKAQ